MFLLTENSVHHCHLQEWAKHRGSYDEQAPPNWPKLKSNFRSVISKSNDFEETKDYHVLKKQTGNYKVYRLLSPSEVKGSLL